MINDKNVLAIVTARLGSKRVKKKNIKIVVKNRSLLNWTFEAASKSKYIDKTILSSESDEIIEKARKIGFEVPFKRPANLSRDKIGPEGAILHAVQKIKKKFYYIILLQPTSPLRTTTDIDLAIEKIFKKKLKSLVSISKSKNRQKWNIDINNKKYIQLNFESKKRGDYNLFLNGAIFIAETKFFLKHKNFFFKNTGFSLMPESRSLDIDTLGDFNKFKHSVKKFF